MDSIRYGGYFPVEFARDVELQNPELGTTHEIIAAYFNRQYNKEALVKDFGLPICILTAGIHDMAIPNITTSKFLVNVNWYLDVLKPACSLFIWIANTAPKTDNAPQKIGKTQEWNKGVREMLKKHFADCSIFVDVFRASVHFPHVDNIHMDGRWYSSLGAMFQRSMQRLVCK